jgi:drug/metabolite transporter (DMT)-like permease
VLGLLFFDEPLTRNTAFGAGLIIIGALINARCSTMSPSSR